MNDIRQVFVPLSEQACVDICAIVETTSNGFVRTSQRREETMLCSIIFGLKGTVTNTM
jgi:hypothetical protein